MVEDTHITQDEEPPVKKRRGRPPKKAVLLKKKYYRTVVFPLVDDCTGIRFTPDKWIQLDSESPWIQRNMRAGVVICEER